MLQYGTGLTSAIFGFAIWPDLSSTQLLNHTIETRPMVLHEVTDRVSCDIHMLIMCNYKYDVNLTKRWQHKVGDSECTGKSAEAIVLDHVFTKLHTGQHRSCTHSIHTTNVTDSRQVNVHISGICTTLAYPCLCTTIPTYWNDFYTVQPSKRAEF